MKDRCELTAESRETRSTADPLRVRRVNAKADGRWDRPSATDGDVLDHYDILRLRALLALGHNEFDLLAFFERTIAFATNGAVMDEYVVSAFARDESEAFGVIEPLDRADLTFCQRYPSLLLDDSSRQSVRAVRCCTVPPGDCCTISNKHRTLQ